MNTFITIVVIIAAVAAIYLIRYLVNLGVNKTSDAIRNTKSKSDMEKNPPQQENLADRYKDMK